jgi:hypothetical protein
MSATGQPPAANYSITSLMKGSMTGAMEPKDEDVAMTSQSLVAPPPHVGTDVEERLTEEERKGITDEIGHVQAALTALCAVSGMEEAVASLSSRLTVLRGRLHRSKPLVARKAAIGGAIERRSLALERALADEQKARELLEVAQATQETLKTEIAAFSAELKSIDAKLQREEQLASAAQMTHLTLLDEAVKAARAGTCLSEEWMAAAMKLAMPISPFLSAELGSTAARGVFCGAAAAPGQPLTGQPCRNIEGSLVGEVMVGQGSQAHHGTRGSQPSQLTTTKTTLSAKMIESTHIGPRKSPTTPMISASIPAAFSVSRQRNWSGRANVAPY